MSKTDVTYETTDAQSKKNYNRRTTLERLVENFWKAKSLKRQLQQLSSALHLLVILKVIFANSVDPGGAVWSGSTLFACMQK